MIPVERVPGGGQRRYAVPYDRVWTTLAALLRRAPRWVVEEESSRTGELTAEVRSLVLRRRARVRLRVFLDDHGFTVVEVVFVRANGAPVRGSRLARVERLLRRLDRALARGAPARDR